MGKNAAEGNVGRLDGVRVAFSFAAQQFDELMYEMRVRTAVAGALSKAKVLEELNELIEAVENDSNKIHEAADIFYHLIMFLESNNVKIEEVMKELDLRKK